LQKIDYFPFTQVDLNWKNAEGKLALVTVKLKKIKKKKTKNFDCEEDKNYSFINCWTNFMISQVGCQMPWAKVDEVTRLCNNSVSLLQ
jgi:hypothetical protein